MKWMILFLTVFSLSQSFAADNLPRPLPDDPYPQEPYPGEPPPSRPEPPPPRQEILYSIGIGETGRFGARTYQFFPRQDLNRVTKIRLVGARNNIEIKEVRIIYADNSGERYERSLPGDLNAGGVREAYLDGRRIYRIEITASSSYFWKKPGSYRVDITAVR